MGLAASAVEASLMACSDADLLAALKDLPQDKLKFLQEALAPKQCTATDASNVWVLYVKLKVDYTKNPQVPNKEALVGSLAGVPGVELMPGMGKGVGFTTMWSTLPGLRGKFFTYNEETQTCSGVYTFFDKASMDAYMASDLFKQQKDYPHCPEVTATAHQMLAGSERSMDLGNWGGGAKPTRDDVSKAYVLVAHLHIDFTTNPDVPNKEALFASLAGIPDVELAPGLGKGMGFTGMWSAVPGLRSKAFTWTDEGNICSGFYVFFDKKSLDTYMDSELGKGQAAYPHVKKFEASVHEVLPGTEFSIDLGQWPGR